LPTVYPRHGSLYHTGGLRSGYRENCSTRYWYGRITSCVAGNQIFSIDSVSCVVLEVRKLSYIINDQQEGGTVNADNFLLENICRYYVLCENRDSAVGISTGYGLDD
jgi:hypothetical protein